MEEELDSLRSRMREPGSVQAEMVEDASDAVAPATAAALVAGERARH